MRGWFALADELDVRVVVAGSTETRPLPGGLVVRNHDLPLRHLNVVCLREPLDPAAPAADLIALADRELAGATGRSLRISHEPSAERVAPELMAGGWERRRTVLMVRETAGEPDLPHPDPRAREASEAEHTALMRAIFTETEYGPDAPPDLPELLVAAQLTQLRNARGRRFASGEDSGLQSMCELFVDHDVDGVAMAMVEQVATLGRHRERGLAKAVTALAMREAQSAGAELIMVPADREDWPQLIYSGLGCEVVGTVTSFFHTGQPPA